jgi:hypothetical protein
MVPKTVLVSAAENRAKFPLSLVSADELKWTAHNNELSGIKSAMISRPLLAGSGNSKKKTGDMAEGGGGDSAGGGAPSVVISYASQNVAVAKSLVEALELRGLRCWIAPASVAQLHPPTIHHR